MLKVLPDFPENVLGVVASGMVTAEDYRDTLAPAVRTKLERHKPLAFYYEFGPGFVGMRPGALWEDAKLGVDHWGDWGRIAIVTDIGWIAESARLFAPMLRQPVRVFHNAEWEEGRRWVAQSSAETA